MQLEGTRLLVEQRPGDPAAVVALARASGLARDGLEETTRAVSALRGDVLPGPDELPHLAATFERDTAIPCRFVQAGVPIATSAEARVALYRTAQEALTNVRKHAADVSVAIRMRYGMDTAELTIEDVGQNRAPALPGSGNGLNGMRERAVLARGRLEVGPTPNGFRVPLVAGMSEADVQAAGPCIRVLVVDDQTVVREGLELLQSLSAGIDVVGGAADGEEALQLVAERQPDVVLMDLRLLRLDGIEATRRIIRAFPATRVVVLTTYADDLSIFGALEARALGYLTKGASAQEIQRAIRTVHAGEALLEPSVQLRVIRAAIGRDRPT